MHNQRYFDQAYTNDKQKAKYALGKIQELYVQEWIVREESYSFEGLPLN